MLEVIKKVKELAERCQNINLQPDIATDGAWMILDKQISLAQANTELYEFIPVKRGLKFNSNDVIQQRF